LFLSASKLSLTNLIIFSINQFATVDTSVGIATGYGLDGRGWTPGIAKGLFVFHSMQTGDSAPRPKPPIQWATGISSLKKGGRGVKLTTSPPSII
jgi:hypothetical protein